MSAWENSITVGLWTPKNDIEFDAGACSKSCSAALCMGSGGDLCGDGKYVVPWDCAHGSWLMPADAPASWSSIVSHEAVLDWEASAPQVVAWLAPLRASGSLSFGDICFLEDMEFFAAETQQERASRKEAMAARDAADDEAIIRSKVCRKEEKWTKGGQMEFRICAPCKYATLFAERTCARCSSKVPLGQTTCAAQVVREEGMERRRDGRMAGTGILVTRLARAGDKGVRDCGEVLAGCWNHEQHGTCIYVHPEEKQWDDVIAGRTPGGQRKLSSPEFFAWDLNAPRVAPNRFSAPPNRFSALGKQRQAAPGPRQDAKKSRN